MDEKLDMVRGSGNVFRDVGHPNADVEQIKAILAANIIGVLDDVELSTRAAEAVTGGVRPLYDLSYSDRKSKLIQLVPELAPAVGG